MSSPRKIESARANGAKSLGPITAEGLEKSSMNAVTHGLSARTVVLSNEDDEEYDDLLAAYIDQFLPVGRPEMDLVIELVNTKWRQRRVSCIETSIFETEMDSQTASDEIHADTFRALSRSASFDMLNRTESRLDRSFFRTLRSLFQMQRLRNLAPPHQYMSKRTQSQKWTPDPPTPEIA